MSRLSLAEHLARVPDWRQQQGKRHPLAALLNLVAAGVLCGMRGLSARVRFLKYTANPLMPALATRAGREAVELPD